MSLLKMGDGGHFDIYLNENVLKSGIREYFGAEDPITDYSLKHIDNIEVNLTFFRAYVVGGVLLNAIKLSQFRLNCLHYETKFNN